MSDVIEPEITNEAAVLNTRQMIAMLSLLSGGTNKDAATAAGVSEGTVSRWVNNHEDFVRLYAQKRSDVWAAYEGRISYLTARALKQLDLLMMAGDDYARLEAVKVVLKIAGLLPVGTKITTFGSQVNVADKQVNEFNRVQQIEQNRTGGV